MIDPTSPNKVIKMHDMDDTDLVEFARSIHITFDSSELICELLRRLEAANDKLSIKNRI